MDEYATVTSYTKSNLGARVSRHSHQPLVRGCSTWLYFGRPCCSAKAWEIFLFLSDKSDPSGNSSSMYDGMRLYSVRVFSMCDASTSRRRCAGRSGIQGETASRT